jgi:hypothetical protein
VAKFSSLAEFMENSAKESTHFDDIYVAERRGKAKSVLKMGLGRFPRRGYIEWSWFLRQRSFNRQSTAFVMRGLRVRLPSLAFENDGYPLYTEGCCFFRSKENIRREIQS